MKDAKQLAYQFTIPEKMDGFNCVISEVAVFSGSVSAD